MRLEPVSKRPPQHARSGARRAAFHYVVLAVKEILSVARIEGHTREARERSERRSRPFPAVSDHVLHAECTRSRWMCAHGRRIPRLKIKITFACTRRFFAPGIAALRRALRRSVRCAMKLRLRRKFAAQPLRISRGFRVAHVHRPLLWQPDLAKHRPVHPQVAIALPEHRM